MKIVNRYTDRFIKEIDLTPNFVFKGMDISNTDFSNLDLSDCDFRGCLMVNTLFENSNMRNAKFYNKYPEESCDRAYLQGSNLQGAILPDFQIEQNVDLIGWKCLHGGLICKMLIPAASSRTAVIVSDQKRASSAIVLEIFSSERNHEQAINVYGNTIYKVGKKVVPANYNGDFRHCGKAGIRFFSERKIAESVWSKNVKDLLECGYKPYIYSAGDETKKLKRHSYLWTRITPKDPFFHGAILDRPDFNCPIHIR